VREYQVLSISSGDQRIAQRGPDDQGTFGAGCGGLKRDAMNGKRGDHPLTDILVHKLEIYGPEADELIREISELSSRRELYEWWDEEISGTGDRELVLGKAEARYRELMLRSRASGWKPSDPH
jgi:hypothetical protein